MHEPFGIAVIEAMAMGLPVISLAYGSPPELIKPEVGILFNNFSEFRQTIAREPKKFNRKFLRNYGAENITSKIMEQNYLELYEKVLKNGFFNSERPRYLAKQDPQNLLEL